MGRYAYDIEASGLLDDSTIDYTASPWKLKDNFKVHCIAMINIDTNEVHTFVQEECYTKFKQFVIDNVSEIISFNGINYDMLVCKVAFGMDYTLGPDTWCGKPVKIDDLLIRSKTLNPDRPKHSLEYFGSLTGFPKIDWRADAIELGLITHNAPKGAEFAVYHPKMLEYNIQDVRVTIAAKAYLDKEQGDWPWEDALALEQSVAWIITRQSHRGFYFDKELALSCIEELDMLLEERRSAVEPNLPQKPLGKTALKEYIPCANQFLKNGKPNSNITKWCAKHGGTIVEEEDGKYSVELYGKKYFLPIPQEPIVTHGPSKIDDTTFIKGYLVEQGWQPSNYKERDLTVDTKKHKLPQEKFNETVQRYVEQTLSSPFMLDRCERVNATPKNLLGKLLGHDLKKPLKVYTNPTFTVGQDKEMDPHLETIAEQFPYVKMIVEFLTYRHRRSSILGGGLDPDDWEDEDDGSAKGYLANVRADGRIPTPADTCGCATGRMKHKICCNIPRVTSLYGGNMRALFGVGENSPYIQYAYDYKSLEARVEGHYCVPMTAQALTRDGWKYYEDIKIGDEILGYNSETGEKEWTSVIGKVFYERSLTHTLHWKSHSYRTTGDHRWFVSQRNTTTGEYNPCIKTTLQLSGNSRVIVNAPFNTKQDTFNTSNSLSQGKYGVDWTARVISMSHQERVAFLEGFMIADGYWHDHGTNQVWRWAQNPNELFDAALTASYLVHDGRITVASNAKNSKVKVATLCKAPYMTGQRLKITEWGYEPTWCPQTKLGSWVMRQGDCITITGNCSRYDETKEYCESLIQEKPNDVHTKTAEKVSRIIGQPFTRQSAKAVKYSGTYGAQAARIAKTIGSSLSVGEQVFLAFWKAAAPLAALKEKLENYWKTAGQKKFVLGLDGRKIMTRSQHALLNSLFQSAGVICAKRSMVFQDNMLREAGLICDFWTEDWKNKEFVQQLIAYHDEAQFEMSRSLMQWKKFKTEAEAKQFISSNPYSLGPVNKKGAFFVGVSKVNELCIKTVGMTNEYYKMNVHLAIDPAVGLNWRDCH